MVSKSTFNQIASLGSMAYLFLISSSTAICFLRISHNIFNKQRVSHQWMEKIHEENPRNLDKHFLCQPWSTNPKSIKQLSYELSWKMSALYKLMLHYSWWSLMQLREPSCPQTWKSPCRVVSLWEMIISRSCQQTKKKIP